MNEYYADEPTLISKVIATLVTVAGAPGRNMLMLNVLPSSPVINVSTRGSIITASPATSGADKNGRACSSMYDAEHSCIICQFTLAAFTFTRLSPDSSLLEL